MAGSGIYVPGNARAVVSLSNGKGEWLMAISQNRGALQIYKSSTAGRLIKINRDDRYAIVHLRNGKKQRVEFNYGSSYLSQSAPTFRAGPNVVSVELINSKGEKRVNSLD